MWNFIMIRYRIHGTALFYWQAVTDLGAHRVKSPPFFSFGPPPKKLDPQLTSSLRIYLSTTFLLVPDNRISCFVWILPPCNLDLWYWFQVCEERFSKRMEYSRHMRSHADQTEANSNSGNQSDLICPGCTDVIPLIARTFSNQASLNVHMRAMHPHLTTKPAVPRSVCLFVCICLQLFV